MLSCVFVKREMTQNLNALPGWTFFSSLDFSIYCWFVGCEIARFFPTSGQSFFRKYKICQVPTLVLLHFVMFHPDNYFWYIATEFRDFLCGLGWLGQCLPREVVFSRKMTKFEKSVFTASNMIQVFSPKYSGTEDWKSFTENKMFPMYRSKKFSFNVPFMMASFLLKVRQSTCSVIGGRYWESSLTRVCSDVLP